jgi:hypothetical protein
LRLTGPGKNSFCQKSSRRNTCSDGLPRGGDPCRQGSQVERSLTGGGKPPPGGGGRLTLLISFSDEIFRISTEETDTKVERRFCGKHQPDEARSSFFVAVDDLGA